MDNLYPHVQMLTNPNSDSALPDPASVALQALAWVLADDRRAQRFLDLTGLTPDELRSGIGSREIQASVLDYLAAHEPDLVAAAEALGIAPESIVAAQRNLAR
ncbi:DUF3572 domain-containing protein [Tsuneonella sp. HG222]